MPVELTQSRVGFHRSRASGWSPDGEVNAVRRSLPALPSEALADRVLWARIACPKPIHMPYYDF